MEYAGLQHFYSDTLEIAANKQNGLYTLGNMLSQSGLGGDYQDILDRLIDCEGICWVGSWNG